MNPYQSLDKSAFWHSAVANRSMFDIEGLWNPKFNLTKADFVVTYGSCFAQHIGKYLADNGYHWLNTETTPGRWPKQLLKEFNYGLFSSRTGNIYTTSLLLQWTEWALERRSVPEEVWFHDGRYFDPFRPRIEPNGFATALEVARSRENTIRAFRQSIEKARLFVFTMGLTESWSNLDSGVEYPMCPGTAAGVYDPGMHVFVNQDYEKIRADLLTAIGLMKGLNSDLRILLTVSPVPLTATNSGRHVVVATMASKSILRAVADSVANARPDVDYFPSYEIINGPMFRGVFFNQNQRTVHRTGVDFVMQQFFGGLEAKFGGRGSKLEAPGVDAATSLQTAANVERDDTNCEEVLLAAFGSR